MGKDKLGKIGNSVLDVIHTSTSSSKQGTVEVKYKEELVKEFKNLKLTELTMSYYREPMQGNRIYHDFLLLTCIPEDPDSEFGNPKLYIKAEKTYVTGEDAKGTCKEREECRAWTKVRRMLLKACARGKIDIEITQIRPDSKGWTKHFGPEHFRGCGKITLNELVDVLNDHPKRYSLWKNNCWRYAADTVQNVFKTLIHHRDTNEEVREELTKRLEELKSTFPTLPSSCGKPVLGLVVAVAAVIFAGHLVGQFFRGHPIDLRVGNCLMDLIALGLQQAAPRGPLSCAQTRAVKLVYSALEWLERLGFGWIGELLGNHPSFVGKFVRVLSSKVLLSAGTIAIAIGVVVALLLLSYLVYNICLDNRGERKEGSCSRHEVVGNGHSVV